MSNYCIKKKPPWFKIKPRSEININKTKERWSNSSILYRGWRSGGRGGEIRRNPSTRWDFERRHKHKGGSIVYFLLLPVCLAGRRRERERKTSEGQPFSYVGHGLSLPSSCYNARNCIQSERSCIVFGNFGVKWRMEIPNIKKMAIGQTSKAKFQGHKRTWMYAGGESAGIDKPLNLKIVRHNWK